MYRTATLFILFLGLFMPKPLAGRGPERPGKERARYEARLPRGADLILLHGKIWTGEPTSSRGKKPVFEEAMAILDGRILDVGSVSQILHYMGKNTKVIRLDGRLVVPGFVDGHTHFISGGFQLLQIDLKDARSEEEFTRRIGEKVRTLAPGRWLLGGDWDEQAWPSAQLPTRGMIDGVTPNNPVFIRRYDGHAVLANSRALELAGVTKETPEPSGGVIVRDPKTGEPTGVLKDAAEDLVGKMVPRPTEAEMQEALKAALAEARRLGVASVQNITVDGDSPHGTFADEIALLRRAELEGWLTARFYEITPIADWEKIANAGISHDMGGEFVKLGAVKAFADGSLGSATAWMFEPFADDPTDRGLPMAIMNPPSGMETLARGADAAHIQLCVHAIGDRANAEMLDLYERLGGADPAAHRFRIEHAQHVRAQDYARFGKLGVIASMQPYHAIDDGRWAEKRLGPERARWSYAWRSMLEAGAPLAFGTDWPVAPLNPLLGIYAAVTRATLDGKHPEGWFAEERLTLEEALRAYTLGSAYAAFEEEEKGTLAPGKLADAVVLDKDLFTIPPEEVKDAHVVLTVVGGKVVYGKM